MTTGLLSRSQWNGSSLFRTWALALVLTVSLTSYQSRSVAKQPFEFREDSITAFAHQDEAQPLPQNGIVFVGGSRLQLTRGAAVTEAALPKVSQLASRSEPPNPLTMLSGDPIQTREEWFGRRRPELRMLFQHYMYGYLPAAPDKVEATALWENKRAFGGKATLRELAIHCGSAEVPPLYVLLAIPNGRAAPTPVFVGINFCGNHAVVKDPGVRLPTAWTYSNYPGVKDNYATEAGRGSQVDVWTIERSLERGYAVATFYNGDIDPDRPDVREGIRPYLARKGDAHDCGTIAAWAWGVHRVVDYLVTDPAIDKSRIAVVGHSRLGKCALLAAAFDDRIALAIPHQAGCGGTAPSRGKVGESVKQINDRFPHWFNATFKEFNDKPERLPFDQHCLVALVAPRPVLFSNAVEDTWANPAGQFQVLQAADPVYRFLGVEGTEAKEMPEPGKLIDSRLGYYIRPGKHSMTKDDWKIFLDFADKHLGKPATVK